MFLLEPLWQTDGHFSALLAHSPASLIPQLALALSDSALVDTPCYCPTTSANLPSGLVLQHTLKAAALTTSVDETTPSLIPFGKAVPSNALICQVHTRQDMASLPHGSLNCGAWFTTPLANTSPNPSQPVLLELLTLIVRDADTIALEKVFAKAPQLTISLLRLVNSVGMGGHRHTESIHQAIALLGRRQLQRWLQLLLYAEQYGPHEPLPPLFIAAALRAKRMEQWVRAGWLEGISADTAFMAGMLSLLDRLFGESLETLLGSLPLAPQIRSGLLDGEGEVGLALRWLALAERGETAALHQQIQSRVSDLERWMLAEINAMSWVYALTRQVS